MKINPVLTILSLLFAALAAYALYSFCRSEELQWVITIFGGVNLFLVWAGTIAVSLPDGRRNVNFKVLNIIFAVIITVLQIVFTLTVVSMPTYLLCSGILLLLWLTIAYAIGHKA